MGIWAWIIVIAVVGIGYYLWKSVREARDEVEHIVQSGSLLSNASAETAFHLGMGAMKQGNTTEALAALRRADSLGHDEATYNLGILLERINNARDAEAAYERALKLGYAPAGLNLALMLEKQGKYEEAIEMIQKALDGGVIDGTGSIAELTAKYQEAIKNREATTP